MYTYYGEKTKNKSSAHQGNLKKKIIIIISCKSLASHLKGILDTGAFSTDTSSSSISLYYSDAVSTFFIYSETTTDVLLLVKGSPCIINKRYTSEKSLKIVYTLQIIRRTVGLIIFTFFKCF